MCAHHEFCVRFISGWFEFIWRHCRFAHRSSETGLKNLDPTVLSILIVLILRYQKNVQDGINLQVGKNIQICEIMETR